MERTSLKAANATAGTWTIKIGGSPGVARKQEVDAEVVEAVLSYVKALRALGQSRINSAAASHALGLPEYKVVGALKSLRDEGVHAAR